MIKLIGYFAAFVALIIGVVWLANNPGFVEFSWFNYHIKLTIGLFIVALVILITISVLFWRLVRGILGAPDAFGIFFSSRRRRKGYNALSKGIIAAGSGDVKAAHKFALVADAKLDNEPLTLLLKAQAAQLDGDKEQAHLAFKKMSEDAATKMLGLRGLFVEAQQNDDSATAKLVAIEAIAEDPHSKWALNGLFDLQTAEGDWGGALNSLLMVARLGGVTNAEVKRKRAVLLTADAMSIENDNAERALELALEARNNAAELVPASLLAARLLLAKGSVRKAHKILEKCWRLAPHPDLGALFAKVKDGEKDKAWLKRVQNFAPKAGIGNLAVEAQGKIEAAVLVARVAILQENWAVAREVLEASVADDPSARVCTIMAKIEQGELGNKGHVAEWLARAQNAAADPMWLADGHIAAEWAPVSAVTGELDAYEWKLPEHNLAQVEADLAANILLKHQVNETLLIEAQEKTIVEAEAAVKELADEKIVVLEKLESAVSSEAHKNTEIALLEAEVEASAVEEAADEVVLDVKEDVPSLTEKVLGKRVTTPYSTKPAVETKLDGAQIAVVRRPDDPGLRDNDTV
ncbi:MAG: heme biosynthesis protein HemY [Rhizobiales bacterium]|nr:heme biosynthesis protein HemY [Hyphomicrobiales bacterium]